MGHRKSNCDNAEEQFPNCDKHFTRLKYHFSKCKKDRSRKFQCNDGKIFFWKKCLQEHIKYKHGNERYQCSKCSHVDAHRKSFIKRNANFVLDLKVEVIDHILQLSQCMRFPTMWYVRPAKPQISLCQRAV